MKTVIFVLLSVCLMLTFLPEMTSAAADSRVQLWQPTQSQLHPVQQGECSQRMGPFATQYTARQRLQQAQNEGYGVSGIFPCRDGYGTRGYCFNVFYRC